MDLIPVKIKKHVRSNFAGKYDSKQLEFLTSIVSAGKPRISPVLSKFLVYKNTVFASLTEVDGFTKTQIFIV